VIPILPIEETLRMLLDFRCLACQLPLGIHTPQELTTCRNYLASTVTTDGEGGRRNPLSPHRQPATGRQP
jgi:hypothetical protein